MEVQLLELRKAFDQTLKFHKDEEEETRKLMTELLRKETDLSNCRKERDVAISKLAKEEAECARLLMQLEDFSRKQMTEITLDNAKAAGVTDILSVALNQLASDEEQIIRIEDELNIVHEALHSQKAETSRMKLLLQLTEVDLRRSQLQKAVLQAENTRLRAELTDGPASSEKTVESLTNFLETSKMREIETLSHELSQSLEEQVRLSKEMDDLIKATSKMHQTTRNDEKKIRDLEENIAELRERLKSDDSRPRTQNNEQKSGSVETGEVERLSRVIRDMNDEVTKTENMLAERQREIETVRVEADAQKSKHKSKIRLLKESNALLTQAHIDLESEIAGSRRAVADLNSDTAKLRRTIDLLTTECSSLKRNKEDLTVENSNLKMDLNSAANEAANLHIKLEQLQDSSSPDRLKLLEGEKKILEGKLRTAQDDSDKLSTRIGIFTEEIKHYKNLSEALKSQVENLQSELQSEKTKKKESLSPSPDGKEVTQLKQNIRDTKDALTSLRLEYADLQSAHSTSEMAFDALKAAYSSAKDEISRLVASNKRISHERNKFESQCLAYQEERTRSEQNQLMEKLNAGLNSQSNIPQNSAPHSSLSSTATTSSFQSYSNTEIANVPMSRSLDLGGRSAVTGNSRLPASSGNGNRSRDISPIPNMQLRSRDPSPQPQLGRSWDPSTKPWDYNAPSSGPSSSSLPPSSATQKSATNTSGSMRGVLRTAPAPITTPSTSTTPSTTPTAASTLKNNPQVTALGMYLQGPQFGPFIVRSLTAGLAAESSGLIQVGDRLHSVDGHVVSNLTIERVRAMLMGGVGSSVRVGVVRNGELLNVTLRRTLPTTPSNPSNPSNAPTSRTLPAQPPRTTPRNMDTLVC